MTSMQDSIQEVKDRLDIVEVVSGYVRLKKAGTNFQANCPFHNEKTPSFIVSPSKQIWRCFGACDEGGDVFKFVMKIEGLEFPDALRLLADKAGVALQKTDPKLKTKRNELLDLNERAAVYFEKCLKAKKEALAYFKKRGLLKTTIANWRLGYAPSKSKALPMFSGRLMFPILDSFSRVIGFSGRILDSETKTAKYINSSDSLLYNKSKILYGFDKAKEAIRKKQTCVLVEGNLDVILSHQAGVLNSVAVTGSALTPSHLKIIGRLTKNLLLAFDADEAGEKATKKVTELALVEEFSVKIVPLPEKDPADLILKNPKIWAQRLKKAQEVIDYFFYSALEKHDPKILAGKKSIATAVIPWIFRLRNPIERSHWVKDLARRLDTREEDVWQELFRLEAGKHDVLPEGAAKKEVSLNQKIKERIEAAKEFKTGQEADEEIKELKKRLKLMKFKDKQTKIGSKIKHNEVRGLKTDKLIKDFKTVSDAIVKLENN